MGRVEHRGVRTGLAGLLAACAATVALLGAPVPASALIVRLPNGHFLSYAPKLGKAPPALPRRPHDATLSNLDYGGGPVMPSNVNYVIDWQPAGYAGAAFQGSGSQNVINGVAQFFKDLQAASGTTANGDSVSTQYNDASGETAAYNSQLAPGGSAALNGAYLDSDPLPANGCSEGTYCVTDGQLQTELGQFIASRRLPTDLTHEYFVITPPSVVVCFDSAGTECSANATDPGSEVFCGYHAESSTTSTPFIYAAIPDTDGINGCDPFYTDGVCATQSFATGQCSYTSSDAEGIDSVVSHEHNESITDPDAASGWVDYQQCAQNSPETCGGEIGDKCAGDEGQDANTQLPVVNGLARPFNQTINGDRYWLQMLWSNQGSACVDSVAQLGALQPPPGASFSVRGDPANANTDVFDAGASGAGIAYYVWQFSDAPGGQVQNVSVETTSPVLGHTFPAAGTYTVALTAVAPSGRSRGTATEAVAAGLTQAAFGLTSGSPVEGNPVGFSGASTVHDRSVPISSYSWSFGDGTGPAAGVDVAHAFKAGDHTVTLTVTDALGRVSSASHVVTVADRPPAASFQPVSGRAGAQLGFSGHGSDDEAIVAYAWTFGDGTKARGARVSHAFRRAGRYSVTLTATDAGGLSG